MVGGNQIELCRTHHLAQSLQDGRDSRLARGIARAQKRACNSFRSIGMQGVFRYSAALTESSLPCCAVLTFGAYSEDVSFVLSRSAAAPPRALGFNTISTKLRAPFACFAAASPADRAEKISASIACDRDPDPVLFEKPLALFFRQPHASIPETGDCRTVFLANFECENRGTCGRASEGVFGTARMIGRITRHPLRGLLQRVAASASSR
jgi:hypothetical protein